MTKRFKAPIKAVFPVAGLGTRFLPATKASPKEMLVVVNKPLIQYAVEEAYAAGIKHMIFVTSHHKRTIEDHFDTAYELEAELHKKGKTDLLKLVHAIKPKDMECFYVRQSHPLGLGHAVLCAEKLISNEAFAVILADDLMVDTIPVLKQMVALYREYGSSLLAIEAIPPELTEKYGIIHGKSLQPDLYQIDDIIEKPSPHLAPSNLAVAGRYILTPEIFKCLHALPKITGKEELQLTDAIKKLLSVEKVIGYAFKGNRYDCGSVLGLLKANVDLGRAHPDEGQEFNRWLRATLKG